MSKGRRDLNPDDHVPFGVTPEVCWSCRRKIKDHNHGVGLHDCREDLHVCNDCWEQLTPYERIDLCRKYKLDVELRRAAIKFADSIDRAVSGDDERPFWARN